MAYLTTEQQEIKDKTNWEIAKLLGFTTRVYHDGSHDFEIIVFPKEYKFLKGNRRYVSVNSCPDFIDIIQKCIEVARITKNLR
jgi:hypothetical protein